MKLLPLGRNRALLVTGVIWGIWHAPVILMGYNYPTQPVLGVLLMVVFCIWHQLHPGLAAAGLGQRPDAHPGHAVINSGAMTPMFLLAGVDNAIGGPLGIIGWIPLGRLRPLAARHRQAERDGLSATRLPGAQPATGVSPAADAHAQIRRLSE